MSYFEIVKGDLYLYVKITPNSSKNKVNGVFEDGFLHYLKISISAVPEKGKANKEICSFLSKLLSIPKSTITINKGETSTKKLVIIKNGSALDKSILALENLML